ncbi:MAG: hypothetical protein GY705_23125, partial [Bacteroidetes bacterium]|nr:hypothetical protein [Bacteroidota bacterium]
FAVFTCSDEELTEFTDWLNQLHPTIKFTIEKNPHGIAFLDTFLTIENDQIRVRPHIKPTDTKQYVHPKSCHPHHIFTSIPYSQSLRLKRICSNHDDLLLELNNMYGHFKNRGYEHDIICNGINRALAHTDLERAPKKVPTTMIITHHPRNPPFSKIIHEVWNKYDIKYMDKPIICFKRPKNLRDIFVFASLEKPTGKVHHIKAPLLNRP